MGNHRKIWGEIDQLGEKKILPPGGVVDLSTSVATVTEGVGKIFITTSRPQFFRSECSSVMKMFPSEIGGVLVLDV